MFEVYTTRAPHIFGAEPAPYHWQFVFYFGAEVFDAARSAADTARATGHYTDVQIWQAPQGPGQYKRLV
jgi:hypothetical protein